MGWVGGCRGRGVTDRAPPPRLARSIDEDENCYPHKLAFASSCVDIKMGQEATSLNSVVIHQTTMVLLHKPCLRPTGLGLVTFKVDYIRVPVGCTCVLPRTGH